MSFEFVKKLPAPNEIKRDFPVPERIARLKAQRDAEIRDVITGKSDKFLAIIGPCSADNEAAVLDNTNNAERALNCCFRLYASFKKGTGKNQR